MPDENATTATEKERKSNIQVLTMAVSLFGIFMGVWWGTLTRSVFGEQLVQSPIFPSLPLDTLRWFYMMSSVVGAAVIIYYFARWLWTVAEIGLDVPTRDYLPQLRTILELVFVVPAATFLYGIVGARAFGISLALGAGGGILLLLWMATSVILVHWKLRHEERRQLKWGQ